MKMTSTGMVILMLLGIGLAVNAVEVGFAKGPRKGWTLSLGREFPGATGGFSVLPGEGPDGAFAARLDAEFSQGGRYISLQYSPYMRFPFSALKITLRNAAGLSQLGVRLMDETGQIHQQYIALDRDEDLWQTVTVRPGQGEKYVVWGGAADRSWHGKLRGVELMLPAEKLLAGSHKGQIFFTDIEIVPPPQK